MDTDVPPRFILSDLALMSIAHKPPKDLQALAEVRGIDGRSARGALSITRRRGPEACGRAAARR